MPTDLAPRALLVLAGFAFGASGFFYGFYETIVWESVTLGCLALLLAVWLARPAVLRGTAAVAVGGLVWLWLWSLLSSTWSESSSQAVVAANRWLFYAVILTLLLLLLSGPRARRLLIASATAGVLAITAFIVVSLLLDDGSALFVRNRLNGPLDYVNGEAAYLLIGFWPLVAVVERARSPWVGGLSVFAGVQLLSMAVLTQSRGALLALIVSTAVILIVVPRRIPRGWALATMAAGVALALPDLRDVINASGSPADSTLRAAAEGSLAWGVAAGAAWTAATSAATALSRRSPRARAAFRSASISALLLITVVIAIVAIVPPGKRIDQISDQYTAFTELRQVRGDSRLASGGGNRYDYWRIAWDQFKDNPLDGVGAGNYDRTYYLERRTTEDINQAHSVELQTLGETGLVGGAGLVAFGGAVLLSFWRVGRRTGAEPHDPAIAVAAGGAFMVWLVHTSVDWLHLIPGLTGIALCAAAALLPTAEPLRFRRPALALMLGICLIAAAAYPVARQALALHLRDKGQDHLGSDPAAALQDAKNSLELETALPTYYLEAAAYARLGQYRPARGTLLAAARSEPHDFVTWGLLGDLAARRGDYAVARRSYRRASELNPLDASLAKLADRTGADAQTGVRLDDLIEAEHKQGGVQLV